VFDDWASMAMPLGQGDLSQKIIYFKFVGALMGHIP